MQPQVRRVRNETENVPIGCRVRGRSDTKEATATATATGTAASVDCGRSDRSGRSRGDASLRAAVRTRRQRRQRRWWWQRRQPRRRRRRRWWRRRRRRCRRRRRRWRWRRHLHCTQETQTLRLVSSRRLENDGSRPHVLLACVRVRRWGRIKLHVKAKTLCCVILARRVLLE